MTDVVSVIFNILAFVFVVIVIYLLFKEAKAFGKLTWSAFLFVFCALIGNTDRFDSFSFSPTGGVVAKARTVIAQAQVTIEQLQKLAAALAQANLTQVALSGQLLTGINTDYKFSVHDQIIASLKSIQLSDAEIAKTQSAWIGVYCSLILDDIEERANTLLPTIKAIDQIEALQKSSERNLPSPDTLNQWIGGTSIHDEIITKLTLEYANVWETGSMKDPHLIPFNQLLSNRHQP